LQLANLIRAHELLLTYLPPVSLADYLSIDITIPQLFSYVIRRVWIFASVLLGIPDVAAKKAIKIGHQQVAYNLTGPGMTKVILC
jgi:hypothetical protein